MLDALLKAAESYGLVRKEETEFGLTGWQLNGTALIWQLGDGQSQRQAEDNPFLRLYRNIAALLDNPAHQLFDFEAREHTAQVEQQDRMEREARFRFTEKDRDEWRSKTGGEFDWLPVSFARPPWQPRCSDFHRSTPSTCDVLPTPANYAQRSGRAGRAGQPALAITYCASQSPHDQYYFRDPVRMVHGQVNAPTLDLANLELIKSHMHAISGSQKPASAWATACAICWTWGNPKHSPSPKTSPATSTGQMPPGVPTSGLRVLAMLASELTPRSAPWYTDQWADSAFCCAYQEFDGAGALARYLHRRHRPGDRAQLQDREQPRFQ